MQISVCVNLCILRVNLFKNVSQLKALCVHNIRNLNSRNAKCAEKITRRGRKEVPNSTNG